MFIFLPSLFKSMPGGHIVGDHLLSWQSSSQDFRLCLTYTKHQSQRYRRSFILNRKLSCLVIGVIGVIVSICIQGIVSDWMDVLSIYICPLGAGLAGIMFFWVYGKNYVEEQVNLGRDKKIYRQVCTCL